MDQPFRAVFCPSCGAPLDAQQPFCAKCGASLGWSPYGKPVLVHAPLPTVPRAPTSTAAIVSFLFGFLNYMFLPVIGAIIAIVAGHMARQEIRSSGGAIGGDVFAIVGLVLGYAMLILVAVGLAIVAVIALRSSGH